MNFNSTRYTDPEDFFKDHRVQALRSTELDTPKFHRLILSELLT